MLLSLATKLNAILYFFKFEDLIDSHKTGSNRNDKPTAKTCLKSTQNKTWSKWKLSKHTTNTVNKLHADNNKQPNHPAQAYQVSRNFPNTKIYKSVTNQKNTNSVMKYNLHRKLASKNYGHSSSSKTNAVSKPPLLGRKNQAITKTAKSAKHSKIISQNPTMSPFLSTDRNRYASTNVATSKFAARSPTEGRNTRLSTNSQPHISSEPHQRAIVLPTSGVLPTTSVSRSIRSDAKDTQTSQLRTVALPKLGKQLTCKTTSSPSTSTHAKNILTCRQRLTHLINSASALARTVPVISPVLQLDNTLTSERMVTLPKSAKTLTKTTSAPLFGSHSKVNPELQQRTVFLPKSSKTLTDTISTESQQRTVALPKSAEPVAKKPILPPSTAKVTFAQGQRAVTSPYTTRNSLSGRANTTLTKPTSGKNFLYDKKLLINTGKRIVQPTTSPDGNNVLYFKGRGRNSKLVNNISNNCFESSTAFPRKTSTFPKSHGSNSKPVKSTVFLDQTTMNLRLNKRINSTPTAAKLKWRRKSVSQMTGDSSAKHQPRSKNLFGNELETRLALKAKWRKPIVSSTPLTKAVSSDRKTLLNHSLMHTKSKGVYDSRHTKASIQSQALPRRSRLKWTKSVSQSNLRLRSDDDKDVKSKSRFAYNSRFSLKRRRSSEGKASYVSGSYLGVNRAHIKTGAVNKVRLPSKGFFARLVAFLFLRCGAKRLLVRQCTSVVSFTR